MLKNFPLPFNRHWDLLKLAVSDNDGIVIAGSNTTAELLSVLGLKVLFCSHQNVCRRIELKIFACPLLRQMIRNYKQTLLTKAESLAFLRRRYHLEGLAGTYDVRKQGITAVEDMSNGVDLVRAESNFWVDTDKIQMASVIFTRPKRIELFVIHLGKLFSALRVTPYPVCKGLLDKLLLALCDSSLFLIEHSRFLAVLILNIVEDTHIFEVEGFFHDLIAVNACRAVGVICLDIAAIIRFALHIPLTGKLRIVNMDIPLAVPWCAEQFKHKLLHDLRWEPRCAEPYGNLTCRQINGLYRLKSTDILAVIVGIKVRTSFCNRQFLADIAGKVFICGKILRSAVLITGVHRVQENNALQILEKLLFCLSGKL